MVKKTKWDGKILKENWDIKPNVMCELLWILIESNQLSKDNLK
jgi:hypothetical protein